MKTTFFRIAAFTLILLPFASCKSKKPAATPAAATTSPVPPPVTPTPPAPAVNTAVAGTPTPIASTKDGNVRYVVSFYSIGQGVDMKTKEEFIKFADGYSKKVAYQSFQKGREGETKYCFPLTELSAAEQIEFIKKAGEVLSKSTLVHIYENTSCDNPVETASVNSNKYAVIVSFYSKGAGIDTKTKDEFEKFLTKYPKKIAYEPTSWGREGETDYCLKLNELSETERVDFIKKAKDITAKSDRVNFTENAECVHKR